MACLFKIADSDRDIFETAHSKPCMVDIVILSWLISVLGRFYFVDLYGDCGSETNLKHGRVFP